MSSSDTNDLAHGHGSRKPVRTLVVDDSPMAVGAIRVLLEHHREIEFVGFAGDGEEGVLRAEELHPDLILMDLQMPKLDGLSAIKLIRNRLPDVRTIVITVNHGKEVIHACMRSGADGVVMKDRLYQDLIPEIQRVLAANDCGQDLPSIRR